MVETSGRGRAALIEGDVEFDARDATLLRTVDRTGSVARASSELGRSRARALDRIATLEGAFGTLVSRRRGGSGGGGSELTENGTALLNRYDRLSVALSAAARVPETVLHGDVAAVDGELAAVETEVGTVWGLHDGLRPETVVQVRIGADAITVHDGEADLESGSTSARNRLRGRLLEIDSGNVVRTVVVDVDGADFSALITDESIGRLSLRPGDDIVLAWKATATRLVQNTT